MTGHADAICNRYKLSRQQGFPTEAIQLRAAIVLDLIHRTGLHVDLQRAAELRTENTCWCQFREMDPLVDAYCQYTEQTKLRQFFSGLDTENIHPRYRVTVRTGSTSRSNPDI